MPTRFQDHVLTGTTAARPAASSVPAGTLYASTSDGTVYQSSGSAWGTWLAAPASSPGVAADTIWDTKGDLAVATAADTAAKLPVGTNGQVLTADSAQTAGVKWATPSGGGGAWTLLSTTSLAANATFDVSSISGSYNDLILVAMLRCNASGISASGYFRLNNDSGSNYTRQQLTASGSTVSSASLTTQAQIEIGSLPMGSVAAGHFGTTEIILPGYASTTWKKFAMIRTHWCYSISGAGDQEMKQSSGFWDSTAAITRVQLLVNNADTTFAVGSQLRIYGRL